MMVARTGIARYSLSVFAPGTTEIERHDLRVAKRWWFGTAGVTLLAELIVVSAGLGLTTASVVALAGVAACWYWLARTRNIRRSTRTLHVAIVMAGSPREVIGDAALFGECRRELDRVDGDQSSASLAPVESEAIWSAVYDRLSRNRR
jgi:hypothetical protein